MSFIKSCVSYATTFVTEPLIACTRYAISSNAFSKKTTADFAEQLKSISRISPVPPDVAAKVKDFIKEVGFDPEKIFLRSSKSGYDSYGSLKDGVALLGIREADLKEIQSEFTLKHKFLILHELGHLFAEDTTHTQTKVQAKTSLMRMGAYAATSFALSTLFPIGFGAAHLVACGVSKYVGTAAENMNICHIEFAADRFAALKGGLEMIKGGKQAFEEAQRHNIQIRTECIADLEKLEKQVSVGHILNDRPTWVKIAVLCILPIIQPHNMLYLGGTWLWYKCKLKITVSEDGENRLDPHPALKARIARLDRIAAELNPV